MKSSLKKFKFEIILQTWSRVTQKFISLIRAGLGQSIDLNNILVVSTTKEKKLVIWTLNCKLKFTLFEQREW